MIIYIYLSCCVLCFCWLWEFTFFLSPFCFLCCSSSFLILCTCFCIVIYCWEQFKPFFLFFFPPQLFVIFCLLSGTEFELLEVCLGTPEGTDCLQVGRQDGDLRPSDISSVLQDLTHNLCHIWLQDSCEGAELLVWVWYCKISCFSLHILRWDEIPQWSKNVNICHYVRPCKSFRLYPWWASWLHVYTVVNYSTRKGF